MRIVAGAFRGRTLAAIGKGDPVAHLRPTTDRVRESLFNILQNGRFGDPVTGARVLDLFAGSGALGLEALSRGAVHATFVDDGRAALRLLSQNVALCRAQKMTDVLRHDATRLPPNPAEGATLIFLDPPYGRSLGGEALASAVTGGWVAPGALAVWEESAEQVAPDGWTLTDSRRFGDSYITFLTRD